MLLLWRNRAFSTARNFCRTLVMTAQCAWLRLDSRLRGEQRNVSNNSIVKRLWNQEQNISMQNFVGCSSRAASSVRVSVLPIALTRIFIADGECLRFAVEVWKKFSFACVSIDKLLCGAPLIALGVFVPREPFCCQLGLFHGLVVVGGGRNP